VLPAVRVELERASVVVLVHGVPSGGQRASG